MSEQQRRPIPLGTAEKAALLAMVQRANTWTKQSGWVWENAHWTVELMDSLVRKGLAETSEPGVKYELTIEGLSMGKDLLLPFVQLPTRARKRAVPLPRQGSYKSVNGRRGTSR